MCVVAVVGGAELLGADVGVLLPSLLSSAAAAARIVSYIFVHRFIFTHSFSRSEFSELCIICVVCVYVILV